MAQKYDLVLVDTPALLCFVEASALFRLADAAIMVVRAKRTFLNDVRAAISIASPPPDLPVGFVLNMTERRQPSAPATQKVLHAAWKEFARFKRKFTSSNATPFGNG